MANRRRQRTRLRKPAGAFAPAETMGRTTAWESVATSLIGDQITDIFPNIDNTVAGIDTRFRVLIPVNVSRGTVTLRRLRGMFNVWFNEADVGAAQGQLRAQLPWNIQMVPIQDAAITVGTVLEPRNAADQESNRILMKGVYTADATSGTGILMNTVRMLGMKENTELDVKSMRRWDRATWALVMACSFPTADFFELRGNLELRGLFTTGDGL